jgi:oxygen-independent coproporphyrinogen-3 oxidase
VAYQENLANEYVSILCRQISTLGNKFSTIYIGGGTPTVLPLSASRKLFKALGRISQEGVEFSIEANPESLNADKIKLFLDGGVNRISIGVQSFLDAKLERLGRIHSAKEAICAIYLAKKLGFKNISIDLIFAAPGETFSSWQKELRLAATLPIKHISAYALTYEKNTPLFKKLKNREVLPFADTVSCKMYKYVLNYLPQNGFLQYEVSNFAKNGFMCQHNLNYWHNGCYAGLGPGAVSYNNGMRVKNISHLKNYLQRIKQAASTAVFREKLPLLKRAKETAALKIRTKEGIDFRWFQEKTGYDFLILEKAALETLLKQKFIEYTRNNTKLSGIRLTEEGFLFCDSVCTELL